MFKHQLNSWTLPIPLKQQIPWEGVELGQKIGLTGGQAKPAAKTGQNRYMYPVFRKQMLTQPLWVQSWPKPSKCQTFRRTGNENWNDPYTLCNWWCPLRGIPTLPTEHQQVNATRAALYRKADPSLRQQTGKIQLCHGIPAKHQHKLLRFKNRRIPQVSNLHR